MAVLPALVAASGTLTSSGVFTNSHTVTVGGKTYTFETTLTNVDGNVLIGADQTASHLNLLRAINLGDGAGTLYAAATTYNPMVRATSSNGTTTVVVSKLKGTVGNAIATTETLTNVAWGAATMTGGTGNFVAAVELIEDEMQMNAQITTAVANFLNLG